jgi:hypothetical protein
MAVENDAIIGQSVNIRRRNLVWAVETDIVPTLQFKHFHVFMTYYTHASHVFYLWPFLWSLWTENCILYVGFEGLITTTMKPIFWGCILFLIAWGVLWWDWVCLGMPATRDYWVSHRRYTSMEHLVEWQLARETEVFGGNLSQCHLVHSKSLMPWPVNEPMSLSWEAVNKQPEVWHGFLVCNSR